MRRLDLALFAVLVLCAIAVVHTQHRARRLFVDLQREHSIGEQLAADLRRLQADQATLAAANRVERAAGTLHMHQPDPARTVAITALPVMAAGSPDGSAAAATPLQLARGPAAGVHR